MMNYWGRSRSCKINLEKKGVNNKIEPYTDENSNHSILLQEELKLEEKEDKEEEQYVKNMHFSTNENRNTWYHNLLLYKNKLLEGKERKGQA